MSTSVSPPSDAGGRELVERIAASRQFRKSPRQRQLLLYLANRTFESPGCEVREQEIGSAVFGRSSQYDTSLDNIVRVSIHELRKRLQAYFAGEGLDEPQIVEIPKGAYSLVFVPRPRACTPVSEPEVSTPQEAQTASRRIPGYVFPAISLILAVACLLLAVRRPASPEPLSGINVPPPLKNLWSRMFSAEHATSVVVADSNFSLLQDVTRRPVPAGDYFRRDYFANRYGSELSADLRRALELIISRRYTSMADVHALQRVLALGGAEAGRIHVYFARDFSPDDLKTSNVILLGSRRANPWVEFFESDLNFHFDHDEAAGYGIVLNKHPRAGEQERYVTAVRPPMMESYGVVAFVPNLAHTGNVLILEGAGMHATESASELVTNPELWSTQVLRALNRPPDAPLPYFEVVFKTSVIGATMRPPQTIAVRTISPSPVSH
ncbi:MAG TPA: helix-turn-helix domain-containing protein [Bryobacteraceae bacterium]|nr:helix-turn-helix domain-containing protein [Bryobacteraceae bacterium]